VPNAWNVVELPRDQRGGARRVARSPRAGAGRLPIPLSSFVGRLDELARLRVLLEESRLVTLIGFGGIGKSRLALEFARGLEIDARLVDVTWVVDPTMLGAAIVEAVGVPIQTGRAPIDVAAECIAAAPLLLMLDDCESLLEATADAATYLLERCPSVRILATSRAPLGLVGEATWPVPPLSLIADTDAEHPNTPDAVKLFVSRARQVRPEFAPGPHELDTVAQICSELDGIPLAIELAAAWTRVLGLQELRAALADRFGLLDSSRRATPKRSQTLLASLDWSHDLLTEPGEARVSAPCLILGGLHARGCDGRRRRGLGGRRGAGGDHWTCRERPSEHARRGRGGALRDARHDPSILARAP
jgi:predicted ATPase